MAAKVYDYLIIGNSAGAIGCIEGIRKVDRRGSIALVSEEPYHVYSRPLITHLLEGHVIRDKLDFRPKGFYEDLAVETFLGQRAEQPDIDENRIGIEPAAGKGVKRTLRFRKLLIASGGKPVIPALEGGDMDGITPMMSLDQGLVVARDLFRLRSAVILGGGLIGTKTAEALAGHLENVTMVELGDRILAPVTDPASSSMAMKAFRDQGVEIILNETVAAVKGDRKRRITGVVLGDETEVPCDLLVLAAGVRPRTELAEGTRIRTAGPGLGGGIEVDDHMRTAVPGIYACGDCAHAHDFVTGGMRLLPLWPNAYIGGRIAGLNMAGSEHAHRWATNMNAVDFFGMPLVSAGFMLKPKGDGFEEIVREQEGSYFKLILKDDVIQGLIMAGRVEKAGVYLGLMRERIPTTSFREELEAEDLSFLRLPAEVREKLRQPIGEME